MVSFYGPTIRRFTEVYIYVVYTGTQLVFNSSVVVSICGDNNGKLGSSLVLSLYCVHILYIREAKVQNIQEIALMLFTLDKSQTVNDIDYLYLMIN